MNLTKFMKIARALLLASCALAWNAHAGKVVDDRGIALELARPPQRIVTMLPSLAEMVCELGACDRLVGVDDYSNWPAQVRGLPRLGGLEDTNIERVLAL
jgi:iron complex transport system substrate-binding protein